MYEIQEIKARQVLDSRGNPTIEVDVYTKNGIGSAIVPSGASTGKYEVWELRDNKKEYNGLSVNKAIKNVELIEKKLKGVDVTQQAFIDGLMIDLDGTANKKKLGANTILGVSLAVSRAAAVNRMVHLYEYIQLLCNNSQLIMPVPFANVINGGKHADNELSFQEFMIAPVGAKNFQEATRMTAEAYHSLKKEIHNKYGKNSTNIGDEGGFAPPVKSSEEALQLLVTAIKKAGYDGKIKIAVDAAATSFYENNNYRVDGKNLTANELKEFYKSLIKKYPIMSIEDPFHQDDFKTFAELLEETKIQIVADDLTVTNPERIKRAVEEKSANCLLLKVNQIGTLTEALQAGIIAYDAGWNIMVSHRSGESEDPYIADLAVGMGSGMIKLGAPARADRTAKYNQLLRIEEQFKARYYK